jgi:hypothetical protein
MGRPYSIRATPAPGFIFAGWSGLETSLQRTITVTLDSNESLVAHFAPNPFIGVKGSYSGLVTSQAMDFVSTGLLTGTVSGTGFFSGKLQLGNESYVLSGPLTAGGEFAASITAADDSVIEVSLQVDVSGDSQQLSGTITRADVVTTVLANRRAFDAKSNPTALAGKYTVVLAPTTENSGDAFPQGCGVAVVRVKRDGSVRLAGRAGDGSVISSGSFLGTADNWPLFARLYGGGGAMLGVVTHRDVPGTSDLDGDVHWNKPARPFDQIYPNGFETQSHLFGSFYLPNTPVIGVTSSTPNLGIDVRGADLEAPIAAFATLTLQNRILVEPSPARIHLALAQATGLFHGKLRDPATNQVRSVFGAFVQKQNRGFGLVRGANLTGPVALDPLE